MTHLRPFEGRDRLVWLLQNIGFQSGLQGNPENLWGIWMENTFSYTKNLAKARMCSKDFLRVTITIKYKETYTHQINDRVKQQKTKKPLSGPFFPKNQT